MIKAKIETVTPERAQKWLSENNRGNRQLSTGHVASLARALERNEWRVHHQGIAFTTEGRLLDGQHRLAAIVQARKSAEIMVARGVDPATFSVMDTGKRRTARDLLHLEGEKRAQQLAAALRGLFLYRRAPKAGWLGPSASLSHDQLRNLLNENPGIRSALEKGFSLNREVRLSITAAAVGWHVTSTDRPDINQDDWYEGLATGANLKRNDPRLVLRNTMFALRQGRSSRKRDDSREHLAYYLKAWNAWAEGRSIKLLRRNAGEALPLVTLAGASEANDEGRLM
ncbi:hypothetical protein [Streptomyces rimosus]|uniref:hypothetical protein n=1 Tax=Streptomyces rimosus TaxID=1927 RepID=UPI001F30CE93|nr:hypothetical protein [Streptomyces rimosus]